MRYFLQLAILNQHRRLGAARESLFFGKAQKRIVNRRIFQRPVHRQLNPAVIQKRKHCLDVRTAGKIRCRQNLALNAERFQYLVVNPYIGGNAALVALFVKILLERQLKRHTLIFRHALKVKPFFRHNQMQLVCNKRLAVLQSQIFHLFQVAVNFHFDFFRLQVGFQLKVKFQINVDVACHQLRINAHFFGKAERLVVNQLQRVGNRRISGQIYFDKVVILVQIIQKHAAPGQNHPVGNALVHLDVNFVLFKQRGSVHVADNRHPFQIVQVRVRKLRFARKLQQPEMRRFFIPAEVERKVAVGNAPAVQAFLAPRPRFFAEVARPQERQFVHPKRPDFRPEIDFEILQVPFEEIILEP